MKKELIIPDAGNLVIVILLDGPVFKVSDSMLMTEEQKKKE
jgi:hypothetical protein